MNALANLNDYQLLEDDLAEAEQTIKELRDYIDCLNESLSDKEDELSKYKEMGNVLKQLLEAEKKADDLERETKHDLAYDLWHMLREATKRLHDMVHPPIKIVETIQVGDMTVRLTTKVPQYG